VNTCEAGLWVAFDVLCSPPNLGRGDAYRARYLAPYEKHLHHQGAYGRPFPPRYKDILADRGCTAGELGFYGKRLPNLDTVIVPLAGANYEPHGIKYHPAPQLTGVDVDASMAELERAAVRHAELLTGVASLGYDTPGYGYGDKVDGVPRLQMGLAALAQEYNVPYIMDNAWGLPFVGTDPRDTGADVIIYSMDKATGSATSGLIIGREEFMVSIRRALGLHGERWGTPASYGKAAYVTQDPGKEALLTQVVVLKELRDNPAAYKDNVDRLYTIVTEEFDRATPELKRGLLLSKSYNSGTVEVNYERTWQGDGLGFPIFTIEDMYAGSHILQVGCKQMGVIPTVSYDGNIFISPGLGTCDADGVLDEARMRPAVRALVGLMNIVAEESGFDG